MEEQIKIHVLEQDLLDHPIAAQLLGKRALRLQARISVGDCHVQ